MIAAATPLAGVRVWWMSTEEAGTRQQARGLARAIDPAAEERLIRVSRAWALAPTGWLGLPGWGVQDVEGAVLAPPWPDVLVTCGRRAALVALAIRRVNPAPMVLAHVQPPPHAAAFDLVVAMPHDDLRGANVVTVDTALHDISAEDLARAAAAGDPRFDGLPRPWTGVLVGGTRHGGSFDAEDARRLCDGLDALRALTGGSLLITPSRRTPPQVLAALDARYLADPGVRIWDGGPPNPYRAILALSDWLVVTSDSISMISEALATRAPVLVFDHPCGPRHARFVENLRRKRLVGRLGEAPPPPHAPVDSRPIVAAALRVVIAQRLGGVADSVGFEPPARRSRALDA